MDLFDFLAKLLDTSDFPPRWHCGVWSDGHGWLHIASDLAIWSAYFTIPLLLLFFVFNRRDVPYPAIFLLFGAFILLCGTTHLMEAVLFWWPAYRLAGAIKLGTAISSWATVAALIPFLPQALALRGPRELEEEVRARTAELARIIQGLQHEISERCEVEHSLRRSEQELRAVLDQMPSGVLIAEVPSGRIVAENRRIKEIWRQPLLASGDVEAISKWKGFHPDGRPYQAHEWPLARTVLHGETIHGAEVEIVRGDGTHGFVHINAAPIRDEGGIVTAGVAVHDDITDLKRAQEELRRAHEFSENLVETARTIVLVLDTEGRIVQFNSYLQELTGWHFEEVQGKDWFDTFLPERDRQRIRGLFERALAGEKTQGNVNVVVTKEGRERTIEWFDAALKCAQGKRLRLLCTGHDITDRVCAEEALRASEERLRSIINAVPALISYVGSDRRYVVNNRAYEEWFGHSRGALAGRKVEELLGPEAWSVAGPKLEAAFSGQTVRYEAELGYRDGGTRWVDAAYVPEIASEGQIVGVVVLVQDITDRVRAEEALRASEERLRAVVETAADAIITIDPTGKIESFNPAAEVMFGYAADEAVGRNVSLLMPSPYREEHDGYLAHYRETGERRIIGQLRRMVGNRKDGTQFPIELSVSEINHTGGYSGIVRDVSVRQALQNELLMIAEAEQQRIGQDLHDDVGQELTGLGLTAEALLEALEEYGLAETKIASRVVVGLRRTHEKVRLLSHGLVPVQVDGDGLMSALAELAARLGTADGVKTTFCCPQPVVVSDSRVATHLFRIAQEAVANAARHARAQHICVMLMRDNGEIHLEIRDDGIGISERTTKNGSGLRIMRHRADLIGGRFRIEPMPGGGTRVLCSIWERNANEWKDLDKHRHVGADHR